MDPSSVLRRAIREKSPVRIRRRLPQPSNLHGIPLRLGRQLALVHLFDDFTFDGFCVFPIAQIRDVRLGEYESFAKRVLTDNGQFKALGRGVPQVRLTDWPAFFRSIAKHVKLVIVECERPKDDIFCVGPIVGVNDRVVGIHHFNATAEWDARPSGVRHRDITYVRFLDSYSLAFAPYLGPRPETE